MKRWLTEEIDRKPYICDLDKLKSAFDGIETSKGKVDRYFEVHPKAKDIIITVEKRKKRFRDSALSYLALESGNEIDIIPSSDKADFEIEEESREMAKVLSYGEACEMVHNAAMDKDGWLDDNLLIKAHTKLFDNDPERLNFVRYRFRSEKDPVLLVGQGYFNPVEGELVATRMNFLFTNYYNAWREDHPIVKGAKFVTEYVRIQPHMDANKRTALMALNFILEKNGYPDIYINKAQADRFFEALKVGMLDRDVTDLANLIAENVQLRLNTRIKEIREYRIKNFQEEINRKSFTL